MSAPFSWEKQYKRTWENLNEDEEKNVSLEKKLHHTYAPYKKGIIRHFHIIIDSSASIELNDFLPSFRYHVTTKLNHFIKKFYDENPISILSLLIYRNNRCENYIVLDRMSETENFFGVAGTGEFSLMNSLNVSLDFLSRDDHIKEILVVTGSLYTIDFEEMRAFRDIKVHFIALRAEVYFFKNIAQKTHGRYYVPVEVSDISLFLESFCMPNSINSSSALNLLKLGFPQALTGDLVCACCFRCSKKGYECPVCHTKVCNLPIKCPICKTQLVTSNILSQSLYYCYPLEDFEKSNGVCKVCGGDGSDQCKKCMSVYCEGCCYFIHNDLYFCIYCD